MEKFQPKDAEVVHHAAQEAKHRAEEKEETMPTAANVLLRHAAELEVVRDKILNSFPNRCALPIQPPTFVCALDG